MHTDAPNTSSQNKTQRQFDVGVNLHDERFNHRHPDAQAVDSSMERKNPRSRKTKTGVRRWKSWVLKIDSKKAGAFLLVFGIVSLSLALEWWWAKPKMKTQHACPKLAAQTWIKKGQKLSPLAVRVQFEKVLSPADCESEFLTETLLDGPHPWVALKEVALGEILLRRDFVQSFYAKPLKKNSPKRRAKEWAKIWNEE